MIEEPSCKRTASMSRSAKESELFRTVEEKRKQQESLIPYVHEDCVSNILIRLPLDSLHKSMFVCKHWFNVICSPIFVETHLRRSESVLIFTTQTHYNEVFPHSGKSNTLSIESKFMQSDESLSLFHNLDPTSKTFIHFLEFKDGLSNVGEYSLSCFGRIRATCSGLILLDNKLKKGGLIITNPVTRKLTSIPPGTLNSPHDESYGFAYDDVLGQYKVVHLFRDELMYISCEIFIIGTKKWRAVDGPSFGLFGWLGFRPVEAIGALHWIPQVNHSDCIVSLEIETEKFQTIPLPNSCNMYDGIVEIGSSLSFVTHQETHTDIWILKGLSGEVWIKQHSINIGCRMDMIPLLSFRIRGDLVFRSKDGLFYIYDFELRSITKVKNQNRLGVSSGCLFPHVNSMVSWSSN
ncbi:F-box protein CPR30-like [Cucurbita moschata]|uniref:F-box protein CPR30-like n=1 Tax=Cucurbita moschata TaxID=3662 RepID=A0A6J1F6A4_CUCMO|nr:F-box protein CPR30-like [Cucurbita moschata]